MPIRSWEDLLNDAGGAGDSFEPLPAGDYDFVIDSCDATQTQNQKTMYKARCKVEEGSPHAGRLVFHNFVVSPENPNALAIFFRQMNVLGLDRQFFSSNPGDHNVAEALKGKRFRGQVNIRTWNGQEQNEIKQFYTATGPGASSLPTPSGIPSAPAPAAAPTPSAPPAAPAPAPAPQYAAPAAPAPVAQPDQGAPAPAPVQQAETPAVQTPSAPPAAPAPAPQPVGAGANVPAPPPF